MGFFGIATFVLSLAALFAALVSIGLVAEQKRKNTFSFVQAAELLNKLTEDIRRSAQSYATLLSDIQKPIQSSEQRTLLKEKAEKEKAFFERASADAEHMLSRLFTEVHLEADSKQKESALKALEMRKSDILEYVEAVEKLSIKASVLESSFGTQPHASL